jgi:hypothetical protein
LVFFLFLFWLAVLETAGYVEFWLNQPPVARGDFEEDEIIFSIPRSAVLNLTTKLPTMSSEHLQSAALSMPMPWLVRVATHFFSLTSLHLQFLTGSDLYHAIGMFASGF